MFLLSMHLNMALATNTIIIIIRTDTKMYYYIRVVYVLGPNIYHPPINYCKSQNI